MPTDSSLFEAVDRKCPTEKQKADRTARVEELKKVINDARQNMGRARSGLEALSKEMESREKGEGSRKWAGFWIDRMIDDIDHH